MALGSAQHFGPPRRSKSLLKLTGDSALIGGGCALALCSLTFAGYMIGDRDRQPYFPGAQYLAIFAKPSHARGVQVAAHRSPSLARLNPPGDASGVDLTPTGSIRATLRADPPDGAGLPPPRYRVVSAKQNAAWVESALGFRQVRPGDVLSGFGRVAAIERRNGGWALVADSGSILQLSDAAVLSPAEQSPDGRFARWLIFGRQP